MLKKTWNIEPIADAPLGSVVTGIDVAAVSDAFRQALPAILARHGVAVFPGQTIPPQGLIDFAETLGPIDEGVLTQFGKPGFPKIYTLSNIVEDGRAIGSTTDGFGWHSDGGYFEHPTAYTMLYGLEVPDEGGDTLFSTTRGAYESLDPSRQERLRGIQTRHSYEKMISDRAKRAEFAGKVPTPTAEQKARVPEVIHPLVRRHPMDDGLGIYVGGQSLVEMIGMDEAEGASLTEELFDLCTAERFQYRHRWQAGDLVVWDNRHTMHRATPFDKERKRRLMWRVSVRGERPLAA